MDELGIYSYIHFMDGDGDDGLGVGLFFGKSSFGSGRLILILHLPSFTRSPSGCTRSPSGCQCLTNYIFTYMYTLSNSKLTMYIHVYGYVHTYTHGCISLLCIIVMNVYIYIHSKRQSDD